MRKAVLVVLLAALTATATAESKTLRVGLWWLETDREVKKHGGVADFVAWHKAHGFDYFGVKTADAEGPDAKGKRWHSTKAFWYRTISQPLLRALVAEAHRQGIEVFGWAYVYAKNPAVEVAMAKRALDCGIDEFVINAEKECARRERYDAACVLTQAIRHYRDARHPKARIILSTLARADRGLGADFPYINFFSDAIHGRYEIKGCDEVRLQSYGGTFGWSMDKTVSAVDAMFQKKFARWRVKGRGAAIRPWVHTGEVGRTDNGHYVTAGELRQFLSAVVKHGHSQADLWRGELLTRQHLAVVHEFTRQHPDKGVGVSKSQRSRRRAWWLFAGLAVLLARRVIKARRQKKP